MVRQTVKKLRGGILDLVWAFGGSARPESSDDFPNWQQKNNRTQKAIIREPFTESVPPIPFAGNSSAIEPAMASLSRDLRAAYPMDFNVSTNLSFGQEYVVTIPNGRLLSSLGIVIGPDNVHLRDLSGGSFRGLSHHPLNFEGNYVPPIKRLNGTALVLATGLGQRNYYHWTTEILPRLRLLERIGAQVDFYCIPKRHRYHYDSLLMMGIPRERLIPLGKYTHLQAEFLMIPSVNRQEITSENAQFLYDKLAVRSEPQSISSASQKIYIARRRRHWRCVLNESELMSRLKPMGFKRYFLEDMSMQEQVRLFYNASVVVGPHGSGLVNLLYCKSGTRVVEIGTPVRPNGLFRIIAHHRRLQYVNYFGTAANIRGDESNIKCDVNELVKLISETERCLKLE